MEKQLPKNWVQTELGNYAILKNGYAFKSSDFQNDGIPVVRISNIKDFKIDIENSICVDESKLKSDFIVSKGDILIAMSGATTGKYGVFEHDIIVLQNQRVGNLKPVVESLSNKRFILYLLGSLKEEIEEKAYGAAQPNISPKLIESINIFLPPLAEQNRIVAKLDALFAQLETIKTSMAKVPLLLKDFRQQVLTQAVTGKLTEEWRRYNEYNSLELCKRLKEHHKKSGGHKKGNAAEHDIEKHLNSFQDIPENWQVIELKELCKQEKPITYGILMPGPEIEGGRPYLKVMSYPNNVIDYSKVRHTSVEIEKNFVRSRLSEGDIVLSIRGTVGRVIIVPKDLDGANLTQDSARISLQKTVSNLFIAYVLKSKILQDIMDSVTKGVAVRGINIGDVRHLRIPLPSFEEQQEIVSRVESLFAKADAIEKQYETLKVKIENLPQAILHKAFKGELTEQLDSDGDARELLTEIEGLKAGMGKKVKNITTKSVAKKVKFEV
ncbi:restriction endonuclease subunit S [Flavobacterium sp.]|uniref:restriction endonuclease subunit S n=3 Tax=Flavobacterium sp. TaxID=239 RepID=UPI004047435D